MLNRWCMELRRSGFDLVWQRMDTEATTSRTSRNHRRSSWRTTRCRSSAGPALELLPAVMRALQGERRTAYFSIEIALESAMPTYSGGLGVLAGDTIRSAADLRVPMVAVSLLHRTTFSSDSMPPAGTGKSPSNGRWSSFWRRCQPERH
jgi:hypothetical protein